MKQRNVGDSGLRVSSLGIRTSAPDALVAFVENGGNFVEYAPGLPLDSVNRRDLVVSAHVGFHPERPAGNRVDNSRRGIISQLDSILERCGHVDLLSVAHFDPRTPLDEVTQTLHWAVETGRARYVGVSGYRAWQLALSPKMTAVHHEYSLLRRLAEEELMPAAAHLGVGLIAQDPLPDALVPSPKVSPAIPQDPMSSPILDALITAAMGLDTTPAALALAWVLKRSTTAVLPVSSPEEVEEFTNLPPLPRAIDQALDDVSRVG